MTSLPVQATKRGGVRGTSRWCPTPEQLMLLQGIYRDGLKTPTATQIQQITTSLSIYGKIQGKNVFYWFQNHKARDRQKLRKKLMMLYQQHHLNYPANEHPFLPVYQVDGVEDSLNCKPMINNWKCDCQLMTMMRRWNIIVQLHIAQEFLPKPYNSFHSQQLISKKLIRQPRCKP